MNNLMDYSLLLIKARKSNSVINNINADLMPALVFLKDTKGGARLELRNSILISNGFKSEISFNNYNGSSKISRKRSDKSCEDSLK